MTTTTANTPVRKTHQMVVIERRHDNRDIRDIILDALVNCVRDRDAATMIGIYPSTLSHWIPKLNLSARAEAIRTRRANNQPEPADGLDN